MVSRKRWVLLSVVCLGVFWGCSKASESVPQPEADKAPSAGGVIPEHQLKALEKAKDLEKDMQKHVKDREEQMRLQGG